LAEWCTMRLSKRDLRRLGFCHHNSTPVPSCSPLSTPFSPKSSKVSTGIRTKIGGVELRLLSAGHLLGAAMVELRLGDDDILITGDFAVRDVGGLKVESWPKDEYALVMMEATMAGWGSLPFADPAHNRTPLLAAVADAIRSGAERLSIPAQAMGQAQETYAALAMAQRAGAFPEWCVYLAGLAATVSDLYHRELKDSRGPWRRQSLTADSHIPGKSIVITSAQTSGVVARGGAEIDECVVINEPTYTHAGWGEHMALALGVQCRNIAFYHGDSTSLALSLANLGFHICTLPLETPL
jgi:Cft2 family RNA processing exonuclease